MVWKCFLCSFWVKKPIAAADPVQNEITIVLDYFPLWNFTVIIPFIVLAYQRVRYFVQIKQGYFKNFGFTQ